MWQGRSLSRPTWKIIYLFLRISAQQPEITQISCSIWFITKVCKKNNVTMRHTQCDLRKMFCILSMRHEHAERSS